VTHAGDGTTRVFIDGSEVAGGSQDLDETYQPRRIGYGNTTPYDGKIAWVRLWNTDESANVAAIYAARLVSSSGLLIKVLLQTGQLTPSKYRRTPSGNYEVWSFAQR
jgi:hypothetical protein